MLSMGLQSALSDFDTNIAMLQGDYMCQVVENVIGGVLTILDDHFMCWVVSLGRILLQHSGSAKLLDPMIQ
jgi:hypothetical protein